ncbi:probable metal-nicotianamine transporter YSL6 [Selaginella moellendorffii]|nr:probable metal-nicotianamine transporter YSL6 [Selaginella moellendorffii]|eukprot:XP_002986072.2 probable metal-nicotianamine transporter YSL6 [Selaginella moellendorffii]
MVMESSSEEHQPKHTRDVQQQFPAEGDETFEKEGQWDGSDVLVNGNGKECFSVEELFEKVAIPRWQDQITLRALVVSAILGGFFCIITHKLSLTVGIIPSLNVSAGLLGFFMIKFWNGVFTRLNFWSRPFTRQENTVVQTCVVACYGIAFSGGFGTYLLGLDDNTYKKIGASFPGNRAVDVKTPALGWIFAFIFTVSFLGILVIVPLSKIMILKYRLTYPSGTATAILINSFHTPEGAKTAKKQVKCLAKTMGLSFFFSFFKWFYSGDGESACGFDNFPTLGLKALNNKFLFDFNLTYVGAGMICPHIVNVSVLLGAIISWGIMWPLISTAGWYDKSFKGSNFRGLYGYKVFVAIALILGDGLYNFIKVVVVSVWFMYKHYKTDLLPITAGADSRDGVLTTDEKKRNETFLKGRIPFWLASSCYIGLAAISTGVIPQIFPPMRWYFVMTCYILAPVLAFCNAYGTGLTDWSLSSTYGKIGLFVFAAWAGAGNGGVVAGLAACGVMMTIVSTASDLMQDFKTGYLTRSSPRSMFVAQIVGTFLGCVLAPLTFWMFWKAFPIGDENGQYKAPYAVIYRQMAIIGVQGFSALPAHCLELCYAFFAMAVVVNGIRDLLPKKYSKYIPIPMAMAIPFYIGAYFAIDMFIGTVIVFIWQQLNRKKSEIYVPAFASGLICGDGLWAVPSAILALAKVDPPLCMMFYPSSVAATISSKFG